MDLLSSFKREIEEFLSKTETPPTSFGREVLGDPNFVFELREGRSPHIGTIDRVRAFIAERREATQ